MVFSPQDPKTSVDMQFSCHNCSRPVHGSRYASHLEKCLGMGRTGSRNPAFESKKATKFSIDTQTSKQSLQSKKRKLNASK